MMEDFDFRFFAKESSWNRCILRRERSLRQSYVCVLLALSDFQNLVLLINEIKTFISP